MKKFFFNVQSFNIQFNLLLLISSDEPCLGKKVLNLFYFTKKIVLIKIFFIILSTILYKVLKLIIFIKIFEKQFKTLLLDYHFLITLLRNHRKIIYVK